MQDVNKKLSNTGNVIDFMLLKRVMKFARPYKFYFFVAAISAILLSVLGPIRPLLINYTIDNCIVIQRGLGDNIIYVICNMSDRFLNIKLLNTLGLLQLNSEKSLIDNITGSHLNVDKLKLSPYQVLWVSLSE